MPRRSLMAICITAAGLGVGVSGCAHAPIGAVGGKVTSTFSAKGLAVVRSADGEPTTPVTYVVQKGDTLWSLSRRFNTTVERLMAANQLKRPQDLRLDRRLIVPSDPNKEGAGLSSGAATSTASTPEPRAPSSMSSRPPAPSATSGGVSKPSSRHRYPLAWPVPGHITSRFGQRGSRQHDGIDVSAPRGTAVRVAAGGEVIYAAKQGGYGNLVLVRHGEGLVTVYAHLERFTVRKGQRLAAGQVLGQVGSTGRTSGTHLHFEVRRGIAPENPLKLLPP